MTPPRSGGTGYIMMNRSVPVQRETSYAQIQAIAQRRRFSEPNRLPGLYIDRLSAKDYVRSSAHGAGPLLRSARFEQFSRGVPFETGLCVRLFQIRTPRSPVKCQRPAGIARR